MSKSYYRVSFLSNSQRAVAHGAGLDECQRATIVFLFQAVHNDVDTIYIKATEEQVFRPLISFHNGIILIVNCLKSFAKIQLFPQSYKKKRAALSITTL